LSEDYIDHQTDFATITVPASSCQLRRWSSAFATCRQWRTSWTDCIVTTASNNRSPSSL